MPKRKLDEDSGPSAGVSHTNGHPTPSAAPQRKKACGVPESSAKRPTGRRVSFDGVTAYYFPRQQGFCAVPSTGGTALGMSTSHESVRRFTLREHRAARRAETARRIAEDDAAPLHLHNVTGQRLTHGEEEETSSECSEQDSEAEEGAECSEDGDETESSDEVEDSTAPLNGHGKALENGGSSSSIAGLESTLDTSSSSLESGEEEGEDLDEAAYFQPLGAKQRVALLRECGVAPEIRAVKQECAEIRASRQVCGCSCEGACEPATCACAQSGIRCQVDRSGFPCGCSVDGCGNPSGRIEFDPVRVRSHYLHTMLRLKMEQAHNWSGRLITPSRHMRFSFEEAEAAGVASPSNAIPTSWDPTQGPAVLARHNSSTDSGIDSPPVTLHALYAHQTPREETKPSRAAPTNGYHAAHSAAPPL